TITSMNLYTKGNGLFGTHVTLKDIEEDMQRALGTTAVFGPHKSVKDIGDKKGYMSKIVLVEPDWHPKDKQLPEKFLVKIPTQLVMQNFQKQIEVDKDKRSKFDDPDFKIIFEKNEKRCHNAEVVVYNQLARIPEGKLNIPKIYCTRKFSESNPMKGYLAMEYLENIKHVQLFENTSIDQVKQILRFKAVLEAISLDMPSDDKERLVENPFENIWSLMYEDEVAHFGCPATDLVRLFSACLSGKDRRAHWEKLLEEYYGYVKKEIGNRKMAYSIEQLKEAYRQFFPMGAYLIVPAVGPLYELLCNTSDEESRKKCLEIVMEKTESMLDDIIYYHERNMKIRNGERVL
ncbi:hypothetical protein TELCIR_15802, partial [Teladorsagia circumcincta]